MTRQDGDPGSRLGQRGHMDDARLSHCSRCNVCVCARAAALCCVVLFGVCVCVCCVVCVCVCVASTLSGEWRGVTWASGRPPFWPRWIRLHNVMNGNDGGRFLQGCEGTDGLLQFKVFGFSGFRISPAPEIVENWAGFLPMTFSLLIEIEDCPVWPLHPLRNLRTPAG